LCRGKWIVLFVVATHGCWWHSRPFHAILSCKKQQDSMRGGTGINKCCSTWLVENNVYIIF